ncbi:MAG: 2-amino-4-hydroxy-6-hydroxymethyldihydropteridine diphosphokinase, partial [Gammaproteobacteria bacterium]|nr:2-amino-4-hydroxy-6-hydroxymethyldihydropteridine diphosphokinase [Gammaproteobacteria bacterium]
LMQYLLQIERAHGRVREGEKGGPRTLDLDLLLYGSRVIETEDLMVPHPRLHERAFVLYPLHEIEPYLIIPGKGALRTLLANCTDQRVEKVAVV